MVHTDTIAAVAVAVIDTAAAVDEADCLVFVLLSAQVVLELWGI